MPQRMSRDAPVLNRLRHFAALGADMATRPCDRVANKAPWSLLLPHVHRHARVRKPEYQANDGSDLASRLRRRRRELGLKQSEAAARLRISVWRLLSWERGHKTPIARHFPQLLDYLSFEPWESPPSDASRIRAARLRLGITQRQAATLVGVDEGTMRRSENGSRVAPSTLSRIIDRLTDRLQSVRDKFTLAA